MIEERVTFCRICESLCGMVATVEDGQVTKLRPDKDHPLSKGYACPKGIAMTDLQNDPDRVLHPLRKTASGEFERVTWKEALDEINSRLKRVRDTSGPESIAWYMGNPGAFSYSHTLWVKGFLDAIGSPHYYTAGSQDVNNRFAASALLYGSPLVVPIPDLRRTKHLMIFGANPLVSHGSVLTAHRIRDQLMDLTKRGGRVVVVDPRRSETARAFEHVAIKPDGDAWLLLSMLNVIFEEGLEDATAIEAQSRGVEMLKEAASDYPPESTVSRTGIPAEEVRQMARDLALADCAAVYGRTGSCLGRRGTLVSFLLDALNVVTGNLDRPGGAVFGKPPLALDDVAERFGLATYASNRSRIGGFPDVLGNLPATLLAEEIETPGDRQIRALFVSAGNPVLSVPDGDSLERAMGGLDLMVGLDFYMNETNKHADFILPATTFLERDDFPIAFLGFHTTPFVNYTEKVVEPAGEAREEWQVIEEFASALGVTPSSVPPIRWLGKLGIKFTPQRIVDLLIRVGPAGDFFGLKPKGLSLKKIAAKPHGIVLAEYVATGELKTKVRHSDSKVRLDPPEIVGELRRIKGAVVETSSERPLQLIGLRELRSHNSWMHNSKLLTRGGRSQPLHMNPKDAEGHGVTEGAMVRLASKDGSVEVPVTLTEDMSPGTVALAHGWGHSGGWKTANGLGGVNVNLLAPSGAEDLEPLAGMAFLNGIAVSVQLVATSGSAAARVDEAVTAAPPRD
ncbi:MAG: molybdopterin-dependent oxidoreductase [Solirubrobacterales bacterium]|nr:molybdopterin-dependent oxidoreductase [Solirubrobacterales bacterium]